MKTHEEINWIWTLFSKMDMFSTLTMSEMADLVDHIRKIHYHKWETIFNQGGKGDAFFIIHRGRVKAVLRKGLFNYVKLGELEAEQFFGEISLLLDQPRSATIIAQEETDCFVLLKSDFEKLMKKNPLFSKIVQEASEQRAFELNQASQR